MLKIFGAQSLILFLACSFAHADETIRIGIGTQDTTINCAAGGAIVRELKLLDKYLPHDGKYQNAKYDIVWHNFSSGPPLNNELLANKLDIGNMADFPAVLGATAFLTANQGVRTYYIATLSGGVTGAGNAIVVPIQSSVQSLADLKGKRISVPMGSTGHAMLLRAIRSQGWDPERDVTIVSQAPEVAGSALRANQIDAHADFVPFGELFPFRQIARKIYDGSSAGAPTTHGVQVRSDFAEKYPELVVAYLRATLEADKLLRDHPEELAEKLQQWTGIEAEVVYAFHGPAGIQTRDFTLKPEYVRALRDAGVTLRQLKKTDQQLDVDQFVQDRFIRQAASEAGLDYDKRLHDYAALPFDHNAVDTGAPVVDPKLAGQVWIKGSVTVDLYNTPENALAAAAKAQAGGKQVRVIYVHDQESGIKLFADKAWYVRKGGKLAAFLLKTQAATWAQKEGGDVIPFTEAQNSAGNKVASDR
jgi:NitT/TauT family transport system substrate-binding protein